MSYDPIEETRSKLKKYELGKVILSVDQWSKYKDKVHHLSWNVVKFNLSEAKNVPDDQQGVYSFVVKPDIANHPECAFLLYVGMTEKQNFRKRFMQYIYESKDEMGRINIRRMIKLWGNNNLWFCYAKMDDIELIKKTEDDLKEAYIPPMNDEFPAQIRHALKAW